MTNGKIPIFKSQGLKIFDYIFERKEGGFEVGVHFWLEI
jgi:hypothetical protein